MNLQQFFADRFNSDPYELLYAAHSDLVSLASAAGIDWNDVVGDIQLVNSNGLASKFSKYARRNPAVIKRKDFGRADIFSRIEVREGIEYPFINFVWHAQGAGSWSGWDYLWAEYRNELERGGTRVPPPQSQLEILERKAIAKAKQEQKSREQEWRAIQDDAQRLRSYQYFLQCYESAESEQGNHPYLVKKGIQAITEYTDIRCVKEWDPGPTPKECLAIPLSKLRPGSPIIGWQRVYPSGEKKQTRAVNTGDYQGACHVIGNLREAQRVCVAEGFATAASVFLAAHKANKPFDAVIMAMSAGNMKPVVKTLIEEFPAIEVWCALDNDKEKSMIGKGNTGLATGLKILIDYPQVKCVYPIFEDEENGNDYNDLMLLKGIGETKRQIYSNNNKLEVPSNVFESNLQLLAVIALQPERAFLRHLSKLVSTGMLFCPMPYSPKELYHLIAAKLKKINASRYSAVVKTHIHRKFEQKRKRAQAFRAFSDRITDPAKRSAHVTYKRFDTPHITSEIREYIDALQGPVIVRAGMGSGKSKHLLRPFMQSADRGVAIAHRVSLIGGLWGMMNKDDNDRIIKTDILHYQDQGAKELAPYANKLAICINSTVKPCWRPLMAKHDFFGLDEATQGLRAILSGKAMANPVDVFNRIIDSIATTEDHAVLLDADANDLLVELCELALARREHLGLSPWTQIHVVELPVDVTYEKEEKRVSRRVLYTDTNRIMVEVLKAAGADEKFLLATDSTNFAEQLLLQLRERWPEKKWLYVSQDTKPDEEVQRFTNAPDEMALRYDGLIYSPAISSGVSIEKPHFTRHFGSFCGQVVPSDAIQMLRRDRTATEFVIGLSQMPGRREENAESIRRGFLQALLDTAEINNAFTDAFLDGDRLSLGLADTTYVRMKMKVAAMEAQARNDFANNLICILFDDGYDVHHLAADEQISALGKAIRKDSKGRVWDLAVQRHLEIETPSDEMKDQLLAKHALSETERAQLTRWEIEHELKLPVTEQSLKFLSDAGKKKLALAELMKMDEMTAARIDREEQSIVFTYHFKRGNENDIVTLTALNRDLADEQFFRMQPLATSITVKSRPLVEVTQRTFATLNRRAARMYFSTCGIDPDTGEGEATPQGMKSAMDLLMNSERRDLFNNVIRFGGYLSKNDKARRPETVFRNICKTFGLGTTKRRQSRSEGLEYVWSITPDSWSFVHEILKRRVEDSLSFFDNRLVVKTEVNDPTCGSNIEIGSQVGSFDMTTTTPFEPIANAVSGLPIPIDWLRSVLTLAELKDLAMLPVRLIRATISGLYMSEHMDQLTAGQYDELKHLRAV
ncbi:plasmid replication protein, CyRepA1 family [Serratia fonticola]|uniref:plasmid replication protein, CyRepA1 family n=1 Tax=Serratia fonticola TaxID=47917 RepID=UPI00301D2684